MQGGHCMRTDVLTAWSRDCCRRPNMYTIAPFASSAWAIRRPIPTVKLISKSSLGCKLKILLGGLGLHSPVAPPVTKAMRPLTLKRSPDWIDVDILTTWRIFAKTFVEKNSKTSPIEGNRCNLSSSTYLQPHSNWDGDISVVMAGSALSLVSGPVRQKFNQSHLHEYLLVFGSQGGVFLFWLSADFKSATLIQSTGRCCSNTKPVWDSLLMCHWSNYSTA